MSFIKIVSTFREGQVTYYAGEVVAESNFSADALATAIAQGWATDGAKPAELAKDVGVTLDIHDSIATVTSTEVTNG